MFRGTRKIWRSVTLLCAAAIASIAVSAAEAANDPYGPPDPWVAKVTDYGPADGWVAGVLGRSVDLGPADGWMARALSAPEGGSVSPDSRKISFRPELERSSALAASSPSSTSGGFDWADAGLGAGAAFIVFGVAGLTVGIARRVRPQARGRLASS